MTVNVPKPCLLIMPTSFYSFASIIARGLEQAGYTVTIANDEYPDSLFGRLLGKLGIHALLAARTRRVLAARFLEGRHYALTLIIKGRGMSPALLALIKQHSTLTVGYNFDSFAYNPAALGWYDCADRYVTFDYADAEKYGLPLVDLFSSLPIADGPKQVRYDVSAILRNHSERLQYVDQVLKATGSTSSYVYVFEQNLFTFALNFMKSPALYLKYWDKISFKSLPYKDYIDVLQRSDFTIDYAHPSQTGITIRCFEALSAQTKYITNNPYVSRNAQFHGDNGIVFARGGDRARLAADYAARRGKPSAVHHRSIAQFIAELTGAAP
ncbi:MAG: hypothetical protein V4484_09955 [Pseudomonadota bacterium]